jgi:hypothetical protein
MAADTISSRWPASPSHSRFDPPWRGTTFQGRSSYSAHLVRRGSAGRFRMPYSSTRLTPAAEECGAGKQILLDRGAYKDMDVCIMFVFPPHPSHAFGPGLRHRAMGQVSSLCGRYTRSGVRVLARPAIPHGGVFRTTVRHEPHPAIPALTCSWQGPRRICTLGRCERARRNVCSIRGHLCASAADPPGAAGAWSDLRT